MTVKTELIALAVRLASEKTSLVRKPDTFELLLTEFFGGESYDRRLAREIEDEAERAIQAVKRIRTGLKFRKIIKHL